ncbi:YcxB family protein [Flavobacterium sp.]|uniref:YcxB family protein n=1 Tax=Flavobacterium sp. TaxID=239 RepID=UPI0037534F88
MKLKYELNENDYLQYQLYTATKSERIKKQRIKSWIILSFTFILIGFLFKQNENNILFYYFIILGMLSLILYPYYQRNYYKNHYKKFIKETFINTIGKSSVIEFLEYEIITYDSNCESKVKYSALEEFNEIGDYIFLKFNSNQSFVIPKSKVENLEELKVELKYISDKFKIKQNLELDWKWK